MVCRKPFALFLTLVAAAAAQTRAQPAVQSAPKPSEDAQLYRNTAFGFRYRIPFGWVDRTKEMREQQATEASDMPIASQDNPDSKKRAGASAKGEVLLAVFERPPEAIGDTVNSAVVIAAESAASYPGLKRAEDYLGPLTELATAKGFKADGDPSLIEVDARELVRADFTKPLNDKLTMRQSTLILLTKGQIVSFTFIAGSEEGLDDLIDGLHFAAAKPKAP